MAEPDPKRVKQLVTPTAYADEHDPIAAELRKKRAEYIEEMVKKAESAADKKKFFQDRPLDVVAAVLKARGKTNVQIAEWGCWAVTNKLTAYWERVRFEAECDACDGVMAALQAFGKTHEEVARCGLWAIGTLVVCDKRNATRLVQAGACEIVMGIWDHFTSFNHPVSEAGCYAAGSLASNDDARKKLGDLGACGKVVGVLRTPTQNADVRAEAAYRAVGNLAKDNEPNRIKLIAASAHEWITEAMGIYDDDANIAKWGCYAAGQLAQTPSVRYKGDLRRSSSDITYGTNLPRAIGTALTKFGTSDAKVAEFGCMAVAGLADGEVISAVNLQGYGACEAVVAALRAFGRTNERVAEYGCRAAANLLWHVYNVEKMFQAGACEVVVPALQDFGKTNKMVAWSACQVVGNLVEYHDTQDGRFVGVRYSVVLGGLGACEAVVDVLRVFGTTEVKVASKGCYAVGVLAWENVANLERLSRAGACEVVVEVLNVIGKRDEDVTGDEVVRQAAREAVREAARWGCGAVKNLAFDNAANKEKLGEAGACEVVVAVLKKFGNLDVRVAEYGFIAVSELAKNNAANKSRLIASNAIKIMDEIDGYTPYVDRDDPNGYRDAAIRSLQQG